MKASGTPVYYVHVFLHYVTFKSQIVTSHDVYCFTALCQMQL